MVKSSILLDTYEANVKRVFADKVAMQKISNHIARYIDANSEQLYYMAPTKRIQFMTDGRDGDIILDSLGVTRKELKKTLNSIPSIRPMGDFLKQPVPVGINLLLREATIQHKADPRNKRTEEFMYKLMMYLILSMYWSIQYRQFKYEPNESVVKYTVNNLNNKFYLKTEDSLYSALYITGTVNHETSSPSLISRDDLEIMKYIMNIRTRISSLVVRFSREVYKNIDEGKYLNSVADDMTDDNYFEVENMSGKISNISQHALLMFVQGTIDTKLLRMSADFGGVSEGRLKEVLIGISNDDPKKTSEIITGIIVDYVQDGAHSADTIGSKDFISNSIKIISKSNTKEKHVIRIKENLDDFLEAHSDIFAKTTRKATKNSYRKAVILYLTLVITKSVNK